MRSKCSLNVVIRSVAQLDLLPCNPCWLKNCVCLFRWCWNVFCRETWYTIRSTPSSTTGESMTRSLDWRSRALLMLAPLTGECAGPLRTLTKVWACYSGVCVAFICVSEQVKPDKSALRPQQTYLTLKIHLSSAGYCFFLFPFVKNIWVTCRILLCHANKKYLFRIQPKFPPYFLILLYL